MRTELEGHAVDRIGREPISSRVARKAPMRHVDPSLLVVTLLLSAFGAVMIVSTTRNGQLASGADADLFLTRQLGYLVAATVAMVTVACFDYRHLRRLAPLAYSLVLGALVLVLTPVGAMQNGAQRWLDLGPFQVQPSELAKLAIVVAAATYLCGRRGEIRARDVSVTLALAGVPAALIYLEPDLGTMLVLVALTATMLLLAGSKLRHFFVLSLLAALSVVAVVEGGWLKDYQRERLTAFLDRNPDVRSEGYNLAQSKIAIGSGGMWGKGLHEEDTQTTLEFIPEQHTDFIFTAVGEQLGFVGSAALLALFALLMWRALRIAALSRDVFGLLLAGGIAGYWAFQVFVNIGMTMGIMPITGIPLPFLSYGGSSLVTNYVAVGILLNIHMRRFL